MALVLEEPLECSNAFSGFKENFPTVEKLIDRMKPMLVSDPFRDENGQKFHEP